MSVVLYLFVYFNSTRSEGKIKREWVCVFECAVPRMVLLVLSSSEWFYFEEHIVLTWHRWELGICLFVCLPFINLWKNH